MSLKSIRLQRQMSQEQLAQIAGLNVRTIQRIEKGARASKESLKCLAAALNLDANELIQQSSEAQTQMNQANSNVILSLVFAALFILFAAKSENASPIISAAFYACAAAFFVYVAVKSRHKSTIEPPR